MADSSFHKNERLCNRPAIERLYSDGQRLMLYPFAVWWRKETLDVPCQVLISVPKRRLRYAVDRNRMKRLTRESYRRRKAQLYTTLQTSQTSITLAFNYIANELLPYDRIDHTMEKLLPRLQQAITASLHEKN